MGKNPNIFETTFETYSVTGIIGEGGAGRVFSVEDNNKNKFAIKCLFPQRITQERRKRFKNEIDFCRKQQHKNLMQVIDSGLIIWEGIKTPFYVMPFFNRTLRSLIEQKIPINQVLSYFSQILDGVEAAHLFGVIHRDLKPENILYDSSQSLFAIADFGIAHFEERVLATSVETDASSKMANLGYSAPEQRVKGKEIDKRADIYALGLILNEMFTGLVPHGTGYKKIADVATEYAYLDTLVERMIQQSSAARHPTIEDVKKDLIGRRNTFVALQQIDLKKHEVIPLSSPQEFVPLKVVEIDWQKGNIVFSLNKIPEQGWLQRFRDPRGGYSYMLGYDVNAFQFSRGCCVVHAEEQVAQQVVDTFNGYIQKANLGYQIDLQEAARQRELEQRRKLEQEIKESEEKARILRKIKF